MKKILFLLLWVLAAQASMAQKYPEHPSTKEHNGKSKAILLHLLFGYHEPGGDLRDRFGSAFSAGLGSDFLTKNNFILGLEGHFFYGNKVNDDPLANLRTPEGDIIGSDRLLASVVLRQRGLYTGVLVGKLFPVTGKRSGIRFTLGAGWSRHKIRVQDDNSSVSQLTGDYLKGYDRLTGGIGIQQFIGWQHLGADKRSNWLAGLEFSQAFTNTLRDWDFYEQRKLDQRRTDLRFGVRVAWTLPFYVGDSKEIFY
ncbi:MAG: hypothetical protein LCH81_10370 [Bacteroidetes bacterium]|nr:hypothetical protein [Bacteroidota bacterium]